RDDLLQHDAGLRSARPRRRGDRLPASAPRRSDAGIAARARRQGRLDVAAVDALSPRARPHRSCACRDGSARRELPRRATLVADLVLDLSHAPLQVLDVPLEDVDVVGVKALVARLIERDLTHELAEVGQSLLGSSETLVHGLEALVHGLEALVHGAEALVHGAEAGLDRREALVRLPRLVADLAQDLDRQIARRHEIQNRPRGEPGTSARMTSADRPRVRRTARADGARAPRAPGRAPRSP